MVIPMKKLMLIDGNSIVNRAFYGIRLLTNSEGLYTNAVYGFLNILLKYLDEEKPDSLCVAFDLPAPTFRHLQYDQYKAQRKGMPDELAQQMPLLKEVLAAMNIAMLSQEGYEADDIIGTGAKYCEDHGIDCVILTGDKDDLQLASKRTVIKLVTTKSGGSETVDYSSDVVMERLGVTPEEFIDVKGLMGDPSDNIPGVAGIGEKTAFDLIRRFHSIAYIYENLDTLDIRDSVRKKLAEGKESAFLSSQLATIDKNVPVRFDTIDCAIKDYDTQALAALFKRLNFSNLTSRLKLEQSPRQLQPQTGAIGGIDAVKARLREKGVMYYTVGDGVVAAATCEEDVTVVEAAADAFADVFADEGIRKIGHNIKNDLGGGLVINNVYFDTLIAAYIISPSKSSYDIAGLTLDYLGYDTPDTPGSHLASVIALHRYLDEKLTEYGQQTLFYDIEMPLVTVLADMQRIGVAVDKAMLTQFSQMLQERIDDLTGGIYTYAGQEFNINSTKQLGSVLFEVLGLPVIKKTKTGFSTDAEVLEKLKGHHEIIDLLMEYRHVTKLKSTYADGLAAVINPQTGRIHSHFNQTVAVTGRISSTEPNLQNIPVRTELGREIRKMFVAGGEDYILVDADYSQIELRVLAHIAEDETMIAAFENDIDIHTQTASQVFGVPLGEVTAQMRTRAKAVNFGIVYGIGDYSLSQDLGITRAEARQYIESYLATFGGVRRYMSGIIEKGKTDGYVTTLLGRRRYLPELKASDFITRAYGERIALNTPIQGSAADIIKIAMVRVAHRLKAERLRSRLVLQVHDELIVEAHVSEEQTVRSILKTEMENALPMRVALKADIHTGRTWYDAK